MAKLQALPGAAELIYRVVVIEQKTYEETSKELQRVFPGASAGLGSRSVRRFCASVGIQRTSRLTHDQLERIILNCIQTVSSEDIDLSRYRF